MKAYPDSDVAVQPATFTFTYTNAGSCTTWGSDPAAPFSPDADCANDIVMFDFPDLTSTATGRFDPWRWDGRSARGAWMPNGTYLVQASTTNTSTGGAAEITRALSLVARRPEVSARIYNAAGLVVATLPVLTLPGVDHIRADPPVFEPDVTGLAVITFRLYGSAGETLGVLTWNGRDDAGRLVDNGAYLLGVSLTGAGHATQFLTEAFTVTHGPLDLIRDVIAVPNPAGPDTDRVWIRYALTAPGAVRGLRVRAYDLAGEPVADVDVTGQPPPADPLDANGSGAGAVSWDLRSRSGRRAAAGLYILVLDVTGPAGLTQRVTRRLALR